MRRKRIWCLLLIGILLGGGIHTGIRRPRASDTDTVAFHENEVKWQSVQGEQVELNGLSLPIPEEVEMYMAEIKGVQTAVGFIEDLSFYIFTAPTDKPLDFRNMTENERKAFLDADTAEEGLIQEIHAFALPNYPFAAQSMYNRESRLCSQTLMTIVDDVSCTLTAAVEGRLLEEQEQLLLLALAASLEEV